LQIALKGLKERDRAAPARHPRAAIRRLRGGKAEVCELCSVMFVNEKILRLNILMRRFFAWQPLIGQSKLG
jgi:hypothetical protein